MLVNWSKSGSKERPTWFLFYFGGPRTKQNKCRKGATRKSSKVSIFRKTQSERQESGAKSAIREICCRTDRGKEKRSENVRVASKNTRTPRLRLIFTVLWMESREECHSEDSLKKLTSFSSTGSINHKLSSSNFKLENILIPITKVLVFRGQTNIS